jgi:hypothetical protein
MLDSENNYFSRNLFVVVLSADLRKKVFRLFKWSKNTRENSSLQDLEDAKWENSGLFQTPAH